MKCDSAGAEDVSVGKRRREATRADTREGEPGRRAAHPRPPPEADWIDARAPEVLKMPQRGDGGHGGPDLPCVWGRKAVPPAADGPRSEEMLPHGLSDEGASKSHEMHTRPTK